MESSPKNIDKAGVAHWNSTERNKKLFRSFNPGAGIRGFAQRQLHEQFVNTFGGSQSGKRSLLELGCGGSAFLPYFAHQFSFHIHGIDYSERGVELAREMCEANEISSSIVCANFFDAPKDFMNRFDAVVSFGVVEHFTNTADTVTTFANFLRPGGLMFTLIPNMRGSVGYFQRVLERSVYDAHVPLTPNQLREAHANAGMDILRSDYFTFMNFGVINPGIKPKIGRRLVFEALRGITLISWIAQSTFKHFAPNEFTSPYVLCIARKPYQESDGS